MPRNGAIRIDNLVVKSVLHVKNGRSRIEASGDVDGSTYTVTIEKTGQFRDDMHVRPDGTLDFRIDYDPK